MKKLIISIVVLIVFIILSIFVQNKIQQTANDIVSDIKELYKNIENENWEVSDLQLKELEQKWEELGDKWGVIVEHEEIDNITVALLKSKTFSLNREKEEALAELREFEFMIDHIPKINKLELKNVF